MRCGTLTGAARLLNVSQPALSQVLLHAEDEIGFKLFERVKGRLVPTPEAEELFPEAERIFGDLENLRRTTAEIKAGRRGTVRLAASAPPALSIVPAALDAFRQANPDTRILSSVVSLERITAMLDSGAAGLGVAMTDAALPFIHTELVGHCALTCLVPEAHRLAERETVTPTDLATERLISYRAGTQPAQLLERALAELGERLRRRGRRGGPDAPRDRGRAFHHRSRLRSGRPRGGARGRPSPVAPLSRRPYCAVLTPRKPAALDPHQLPTAALLPPRPAAGRGAAGRGRCKVRLPASSALAQVLRLPPKRPPSRSVEHNPALSSRPESNLDAGSWSRHNAFRSMDGTT